MFTHVITSYVLIVVHSWMQDYNTHKWRNPLMWIILKIVEGNLSSQHSKHFVCVIQPYVVILYYI